jgi:hypothetical protein
MANEQESLPARRVRGAADRGTSARSRELSARAFELAARLRQQCDAVRAVRNKCLRLIRASHSRPSRPVFTRR